MLDRPTLDAVARLFKVLAEPTRLNILQRLKEQPLTVSDFDIAYAAHLGGLLRKAQPRILSCAFEAIESAPVGSSILVDPPYTGGFVSYTNRAKADLLISLHADGNLAKGARGYHIIVSSTMVGGAAVERRSAALARDLRTELDATRTMPRSTYIGGGTAIHARTDIAGLNLINVPGVMLELGNMRNASDLALQRSPQWRATVAKALAAGAVAALA